MKKSVKINNRVACISFWYALHHHFLDFEDLLKPINALTSEDRTALKEVHNLIYQAYKIPKGKYNERYDGYEIWFISGR